MAIRITLDKAPPPQPALPVAIGQRIAIGAVCGPVVLFSMVLMIVLPWWLVGQVVPALDFETVLGRWGYSEDDFMASLPWIWAAGLGIAAALYDLWIARHWRASHNGLTMRDMTRRLARAAGGASRRVRRGRLYMVVALLWFPVVFGALWLRRGDPIAAGLPRLAQVALVLGIMLTPFFLGAAAFASSGRATPLRRRGGAALMRWAIAWGPFILFAILLTAALVGLAMSGGEDTSGGRPLFMLLVLGGIGLFYWLSFRVSAMLERRYLGRIDAFALPRVDEERRGDRRAPVIYLRSFGDDFAFVRDIGDGGQDVVVRIETVLAEDARAIGPVIAIGEPGYLPIDGAARAYFSDDAWQDAVRDWVDEARFVLVVAGYTSGVSWELETVIARGHAQKLLVVFPPDAAQFAARWDWLRTRTAATRLAILPERPVAGTMIACLDRYGEILLLTAAEPDARRYRSALTIALYELFRL